MKIFLSWSGDRSRAAANTFADWLPDVLQSVTAFASDKDIESGTSWDARIRKELHESNYGIVFVTRDNMNKPWLNFEAGALSKKVRKSRCVPLIVDDELDPVMINGPLGQLQARRFNKDQVLQLVQEINLACLVPLRADRVERCFENAWHNLETKYSNFPAASGEKPELKQEDLLKRILSIVSEKNESPKPKFELDDMKDAVGARSANKNGTIDEVTAFFASVFELNVEESAEVRGTLEVLRDTGATERRFRLNSNRVLIRKLKDGSFRMQIYYIE